MGPVALLRDPVDQIPVVVEGGVDVECDPCHGRITVRPVPPKVLAHRRAPGGAPWASKARGRRLRQARRARLALRSTGARSSSGWRSPGRGQRVIYVEPRRGRRTADRVRSRPRRPVAELARERAVLRPGPAVVRARRAGLRPVRRCRASDVSMSGYAEGSRWGRGAGSSWARGGRGQLDGRVRRRRGRDPDPDHGGAARCSSPPRGSRRPTARSAPGLAICARLPPSRALDRCALAPARAPVRGTRRMALALVARPRSPRRRTWSTSRSSRAPARPATSTLCAPASITTSASGCRRSPAPR